MVDEDDIDFTLACARAQEGTKPAEIQVAPPPMLDADAWEALLDAVSRGLPLIRASQRAGLNPKVVKKFLKDYPEYNEALQMTRSKVSQDMLDVMREAALDSEKPDWRAAQAFLKVTDPHLGQPRPQYKSVRQGPTNQTNNIVITATDLKQLRNMTVAELEAIDVDG